MKHHWGRAAAAAAALVAAIAPIAEPAAAAPPAKSTANVFRLADLGAGPPTPVGSSSLSRTDKGLSSRLATSALDAGDAVTLWWVVFNAPEECEAGTRLSMCGFGDHLAGRGDVSIVHAAGRIVKNDGTANYAAHLQANDTSRALAGNGLTNVDGAEVILVLRTHGPKITSRTSEQLSTIGGACNNHSDVPPGAPAELVGELGPNDCTEVQLSVHNPEGS